MIFSKINYLTISKIAEMFATPYVYCRILDVIFSILSCGWLVAVVMLYVQCVVTILPHAGSGA